MESWICLTSVVSLPYRLTRWFYGTLGGDRWCVDQKWRKAQCVTGPCVCSHHSQGLKGHPQGGHKPWQLQGPSSGLQQQEQGMSLPEVPWRLFLLLQLLGLCLGGCTLLLLLLPQVRAYYITQFWAHRASLEGWGMLSYNLSLEKDYDWNYESHPLHWVFSGWFISISLSEFPQGHSDLTVSHLHTILSVLYFGCDFPTCSHFLLSCIQFLFILYCLFSTLPSSLNLIIWVRSETAGLLSRVLVWRPRARREERLFSQNLNQATIWGVVPLAASYLSSILMG